MSSAWLETDKRTLDQRLQLGQPLLGDDRLLEENLVHQLVDVGPSAEAAANSLLVG